VSDWYALQIVFRDSKADPITGPSSEDESVAMADLAAIDAVIDTPDKKVQGVAWYSGLGREIRAAHIVTTSY
jgi:hypothetical protein